MYVEYRRWTYFWDKFGKGREAFNAASMLLIYDNRGNMFFILWVHTRNRGLSSISRDLFLLNEFDIMKDLYRRLHDIFDEADYHEIQGVVPEPWRSLANRLH